MCGYNIPTKAAALFAACFHEFGECDQIIINKTVDGIQVNLNGKKIDVITGMDKNGAYISLNLQNADEPDCNQCVLLKNGCNYETSTTCITKKAIYVYRTH